MQVEKLARLALATCGAGPVLHVGCGNGSLVRLLLRMGCRAEGFDTDSAAVAAANACTPGRFHSGSFHRLPFSERQFDTVVCERLLETLEDEDVDQALAQLARVAGRSLLAQIRLSSPGTDEKGSRRDRAWWESRLCAAGFRKHPAYYRVIPYEALDLSTPEITVVMEVAPSARGGPRGDALAATVPDLLCRPGPGADAQLVRYHLAADLVRSGDRVLDVACGAGEGTHLVRSLTQASQVIGITSDGERFRHALKHYGAEGRIEFRHRDSRPLAEQPDHSIDILLDLAGISASDADAWLDEIERVLRPGGRLILAVPRAAQADAPVELDALLERISSRLLVQRVYCQAVGEPESRVGRRLLRETSPKDASSTECDLWIVVASVDVTRMARLPYEEIYYAYSRPPADLLAFPRDYENPWLVRSLVEYPTRYLNPEVLTEVASRVAGGASPGSCDEAAGLCVLGYRLLENDSAPAADVDAMIGRLARYVKNQPGNPHQQRWRISLSFLQGQLLLKRGLFDEAERVFAGCRRLDCLAFSPTLGTKTVLGSFLAGWLARGRGDLEAARAHWRDGIEEARRLLQCDWTEFLGRFDHPLPFPLVTAVEFLDTANLCANGLRWTAPDGRATAFGEYTQIHQGWKTTLEERWQAIRDMNDMIRDRDATIVDASRLIRERDAALDELNRWLKHARELAEERLEALQRLAAGLQETTEQRDKLLRDLAAAAALAEERYAAIQHQSQMIDERDESVRRISSELEAAGSLARERYDAIERQSRMIAERDAHIQQLVGELQHARSLAEERLHAIEAQTQMIRERDETIRELRESSLEPQPPPSAS